MEFDNRTITLARKALFGSSPRAGNLRHSCEIHGVRNLYLQSTGMIHYTTGGRWAWGNQMLCDPTELDPANSEDAFEQVDEAGHPAVYDSIGIDSVHTDDSADPRTVNVGAASGYDALQQRVAANAMKAQLLFIAAEKIHYLRRDGEERDGYLIVAARNEMRDAVNMIRPGGGRSGQPVNQKRSGNYRQFVDLPDHLYSEVLELLTPTQRVVIDGLLLGKTHREIGEFLDCSAQNVTYHRGRAVATLMASDYPELQRLGEVIEWMPTRLRLGPTSAERGARLLTHHHDVPITTVPRRSYSVLGSRRRPARKM